MELVDWAENIIMDGDLEEENYEALRDIVSRLGVADVKAFGLTWEECELFLKQLGYSVNPVGKLGWGIRHHPRYVFFTPSTGRAFLYTG